MTWLFCLCAALFLIILILIFKIAALHRAADEIRQQVSLWFDSDTNTVITLPCHDRHMRRLASSLNKELRRLRSIRLQFEQGDRELK